MLIPLGVFNQKKFNKITYYEILVKASPDPNTYTPPTRVGDQFVYYVNRINELSLLTYKKTFINIFELAYLAKNEIPTNTDMFKITIEQDVILGPQVWQDSIMVDDRVYPDFAIIEEAYKTSTNTIFPTKTNYVIENYGKIYGSGGAAGAPALFPTGRTTGKIFEATISEMVNNFIAAENGKDGSPAINVSYSNVLVNNYGLIAAGGGGGGGSGLWYVPKSGVDYNSQVRVSRFYDAFECIGGGGGATSGAPFSSPGAIPLKTELHTMFGLTEWANKIIDGSVDSKDPDVFGLSPVFKWQLSLNYKTSSYWYGNAFGHYVSPMDMYDPDYPTVIVPGRAKIFAYSTIVFSYPRLEDFKGNTELYITRTTDEIYNFARQPFYFPYFHVDKHVLDYETWAISKSDLTGYGPMPAIWDNPVVRSNVGGKGGNLGEDGSDGVSVPYNSSLVAVPSNQAVILSPPGKGGKAGYIYQGNVSITNKSGGTTKGRLPV